MLFFFFFSFSIFTSQENHNGKFARHNRKWQSKICEPITPLSRNYDNASTRIFFSLLFANCFFFKVLTYVSIACEWKRTCTHARRKGGKSREYTARGWAREAAAFRTWSTFNRSGRRVYAPEKTFQSSQPHTHTWTSIISHSTWWMLQLDVSAIEAPILFGNFNNPDATYKANLYQLGLWEKQFFPSSFAWMKKL